MSFVAKHIVGGSERLMYITRLHWVYILKGVIWLSVFTALALPAGWYSYIYNTPQDIQLGGHELLPHWMIEWQWVIPPVLLLFTGVMIFMVYVSRKLFTEIALTNQRLIYKTGLLFTHVEEAVLSEISAETVHNGLLGKVFNYGRIHLDMRFVEDLELPYVPKPYRFLRAVHKAREDAPARDAPPRL